MVLVLSFTAATLSLLGAGQFGSGPCRTISARPFPSVRCCDAPAPEQPKESVEPTTSADADDKKTYSDNWSGAGRYADEDALPLSFWLLGPSPRRAILPGLVATLVAPAVNLYGSGSLLLSLVPDLAREKRLDTFYPVSDLPRYPYTKGYLDYAPGFQRYYDDSGAFEFRYPATYVQDQAVFLRNQDRAYTQRTMDPTLANTPSRQAPRRKSSGPLVAFGPAGGTGEENLSVVVGSLPPGFSLRETFGSPEEGANRLLKATIAKEGVRETTLLSAFERTSARSGRLLYQFEYRVDYPGLEGKDPTYTVCVVGSKDDTLYTFASRVPSAIWGTNAEALREAASSFALL